MNIKSKFKPVTILLILFIILLSVIDIVQINTIKRLKDAKTSEFFTEAKIYRDETLNKTLNTYKYILEDPQASKEAKESVLEKLSSVITSMNLQFQIETILKAKGFKDVLVTITGNRATVTVDANCILRRKDIRLIQDAVYKTAQITDLEVILK